MTARKSSLRIIGGEHRGRRLQFTDQDGDLRPTGDRMRETLFNWLQFELRDKRVLDLFAGSGALGAEALSRGAAHAVLVEKKAERAADLSKQLKPVFAERIFIQLADALKWLPRATGPFDVVFIDPPYDIGAQQPACDLLIEHELLAPGAWVYVESRRQDDAPNVPWMLEKEKTMGDAAARLYRVP
ncbi:MAG: 16S rRNA (guanine(966)-N(2))-methyltransferase RsmD [Alcanivoracaceae bacterium]